jgi:hypothetical protein
VQFLDKFPAGRELRLAKAWLALSSAPSMKEALIEGRIIEKFRMPSGRAAFT